MKAFPGILPVRGAEDLTVPKVVAPPKEAAAPKQRKKPRTKKDKPAPAESPQTLSLPVAVPLAIEESKHFPSGDIAYKHDEVDIAAMLVSTFDCHDEPSISIGAPIDTQATKISETKAAPADDGFGPTMFVGEIHADIDDFAYIDDDDQVFH